MTAQWDNSERRREKKRGEGLSANFMSLKSTGKSYHLENEGKFPSGLKSLEKDTFSGSNKKEWACAVRGSTSSRSLRFRFEGG